ncbi:MAG: hypothetical protein CSA34_00915 [Desulfobulbus propionicus]|nr:MAG: hypothetical protein CSA34_00915 [Desulfobulbus propionicus]
MINDRDLLRTRLRFLDLCKSFYTAQPDAEQLSRWRGTFSSLAAESVSAEIDAAVQRVNELLGRMSLADIRDEFYRLLIDPYDECKLNIQASYRIDGRSYGPSLVRFRQLLMDSGLRLNKEVMEDEDSLPVMLDFMVSLVEAEKEDGTAGRQYQQALLTEFLLPTVQALQEAVRENPAIVFYQACFDFLDGYLELEKDLLTGN